MKLNGREKSALTLAVALCIFGVRTATAKCEPPAELKLQKNLACSPVGWLFLVGAPCQLAKYNIDKYMDKCRAAERKKDKIKKSDDEINKQIDELKKRSQR